MKLLEFRITDFRSIKDTDWCPFSADGITVLIGQNESGKSSILAALAKCFQFTSFDGDDLRTDAGLPSISIRLQLEFEEIESEFNAEDRSGEQIDALEAHLRRVDGRLDFSQRGKQMSRVRSLAIVAFEGL
jgi:predicted ATP-dependent endonuclease of OLD family